MKFEPQKITESLSRAYQKQSLKRIDIDLFKTELSKVFKHIDPEQDEDYHKNLIADFLKAVYYKDKHLINVNKTQDLVIRNGNSTTEKAGVILEFKKPSENSEMFSFEKPDSKAFRQLILYYLKERIDNNNHSIKHLIATNFYHWYIFDEIYFEKLFFRNSKLIAEYQEFKLSGHDTKFFYEQIASKYINEIEGNMPCTFFNLNDYQSNLPNIKNPSNPELENEIKLINLYKIFSPEFLLKLPFANDSNTLNKEFYNELLYILGLEEVKTASKHIIERKKIPNEGAILENALQIIISRNKLKNVSDIETFGNSEDEQIFSIALELCITWLNRILFLKLLEGQLVKYHKNSSDYRFLNTLKIKDYDELDELFFDVLAIRYEKRTDSVNKKYGSLPYLNSSLFEITELENQTLRISDLKDRFELPIFKETVLKDASRKKRTGSINTLQYLFGFLNSYNFASDDTAEIQEENKTIISASVLGLIFEKLNGYKDGSFFTPGFITMYICRQTIQAAVIQKFREAGYKLSQNKDIPETFEELKDKLDYSDKEIRKQANEIVNSIKICDPSVGSGHFLVSALNEMIAIKSDLKILSYTDKTRIKGYDITVENDELIVTDQETNLQFSYHVSDNNRIIEELQKVQEALFYEKRTIIENCLFGVDINPKSVMICRLRLWIELLKNAYYIDPSKSDKNLADLKIQHKFHLELQTLPNIDINIKCGNSLISRFEKKFNIFEKNILTENIRTYKFLVNEYKKLQDYGGKDKLKTEIEKVKKNLSNLAIPIDKDYAGIKQKERELENIMRLPNNYELKAKLSEELVKLNTEYSLKLKSLYSNTFEWFIEFPEILDDNGNYLGFDIVMGNPPYVQVREFSDITQKAYENSRYYDIAQGSRLNLFQFFIPLVYDITKDNGWNMLIYQNSFLAEDSTQNVRNFVFENQTILSIDSFPERDNHNLRVFSEAKMSVCITFCRKTISDDFKFPLKTWKSNLMKESKSIIYSKSEIKNLFPQKLIIPMLSSKEYELFLKIKSVKNVAKLNVFSGELDMTATKKFFSKNADFPLIVKGAQVQKYYISEKISQGEIDYLDINLFFNENPKKGRLADFKSERIVMQRITGVDSRVRLIMTIVSKNTFCANSTNYITDSVGNLKYLLGVLNSKLINYYYKLTSTNTNITNTEIQRIPIITDKKAENKISKIVDKILKSKQKNPFSDTSGYEKQIDEIVYNLYELTKEEIEIIEQNNS